MRKVERHWPVRRSGGAQRTVVILGTEKRIAVHCKDVVPDRQVVAVVVVEACALRGMDHVVRERNAGASLVSVQSPRIL